MSEPRFLRAPAVATFLGVATDTLYHWRKRGTGPPYRQVVRYGVVLYEKTALEQWANPGG